MAGTVVIIVGAGVGTVPAGFPELTGAARQQEACTQ